MQNKFIITGTVAALALIMITAAATAYYMNNKNLIDVTAASKTTKQKATVHNSRKSQAKTTAYQTAQAKPACDDGNIVGTVIGGAAGGVAGHQIGKGSGNTAATIAGTLGGAYVGNQYIPTRNATCR